MRDRVCIAGVGETEYRRWGGITDRSEFRLACEAILEAYVHGLNLVVEGARQMRGESTCQVAGAELCLVAGGPGTAPTSALVLHRGG